jgi:cytochrome P450
MQMLRDPTGHFMAAYERYGPISSWEPRSPRYVCAFGPEYNRLLFTQQDHFIVDAFRESRLPRGSSMERLTFGLLRRNGEDHRKHRRLMQPAFSPQRVDTYRDVIVAATQAELDGWRLGEQRHIDHDLTRLITFISMKTMFGLELTSDGEHLYKLIQRLLALAASPSALLLRINLPGTPYRRMLQVADGIDKALREIIQRKRTSPVVQQDVLAALVAAQDEGGVGLTDDELIGEAYTALCHESSAAALTWALFLLDQHPVILAEVVEELHSTLQGQPPTIEQLDQLKRLDAVLKESLRLLPSAPFGLRYTREACQLGPYELPKDATIFFSSYVSHRIPEVFPRPLRFDPSRWETARYSAFEYIPFGAGSHYCMGRHFALLEVKLILSMLLQRFRPSLVPGAQVDRGMRISLVPKQGLPMVLHPVGRTLERPPVRGNIHQSVELN